MSEDELRHKAFDDLCVAMMNWRSRAEAAERALEEAEKVIAPFFALATAVFREGMNSWREGDAGLWGFDRVTLTYGHLRAARKWMESRPSPPKEG